MTSRKLALWECIDWYAAAIGTEHEKRERKVLDQAIDAALADSGTIKGRFTGEAPDFPVVMDFEDADAPPEPTEEMVTAGLKATEQWGVAKSQRKPTGSVPPYMIFEVGEHPRTFIEDILRAALAAAPKEG